MQPIPAKELLNIWEWGWSQTPERRALTLLAAAFPGLPVDNLARLSIGQRDALLLNLRETTFGPQLTGLARCPACAERLELNFRVEDIRSSPVTGDEPAPTSELDGEGKTFAVESRGFWVSFRLPNSIDLQEAAQAGDLEEAKRRLLEACLIQVERQHKKSGRHSIEDLPEDLLSAIQERMAAADPQANIQLSLACPACGNSWLAPFDILAYFWKELTTWAQRTLQEVHLLAMEYGWQEAEILSLSPWRRQTYIGMLTG